MRQQSPVPCQSASAGFSRCGGRPLSEADRRPKHQTVSCQSFALLSTSQSKQCVGKGCSSFSTPDIWKIRIPSRATAAKFLAPSILHGREAIRYLRCARTRMKTASASFLHARAGLSWSIINRAAFRQTLHSPSPQLSPEMPSLAALRSAPPTTPQCSDPSVCTSSISCCARGTNHVHSSSPSMPLHIEWQHLQSMKRCSGPNYTFFQPLDHLDAAMVNTTHFTAQASYRVRTPSHRV